MDLKRWLKLMNSFGIGSNEKVYDSLIKAYSEKHRFYHNTLHIKAVLSHLDKVTSLAENPTEIELALWFHDAIYKPFSKDNEQQSADWSSELLENESVDPEVIKRVHKLIIATIHSSNLDSVDEQLIVDIDLTILGSFSDVYDEFETNIRKEYKWVPKPIYRKKRKEILVSFLNREKIYQTNYFQSNFEQQARLNIERALIQL